MAPKKPTMLQRQRALRNQQQQNKQQASKQIPPKGQTSANSRQARGQRASTAKAQAANQQRVIARGMEGFVRRGQAMDKLDKAAKGTQGSGTRTAGAGGGLARTAKPVSKSRRLPPSSQGANRIGNSSQPWGEQPVRKVNVKDLGSSNALKGGSTQPRQLPPAQQGPQAATRRQRAQAKADAAARGSTGPNRVGQPAGAANRRYGANVVDAAVKRAQTSTRLGRNISVGRGGAAATALGALNMIDDARLTPAQRAKKYEVVNPDRGQNMLTKLQSGRLGTGDAPKPKQGNAQSRFAGARDANLNRINSDPRFAAPKPSPSRPSASRPSQSTPSRSTASGSGSQRSTAPQAAKPAMPGRKWEDFNPGRGTSKSNNPLLDRDSGGMKLRDRMKQREASAQGEKAKNLSSNFGQDSGYQPQTKVDGSKYADKKPDMKKVNEYDRRKKRYYS